MDFFVSWGDVVSHQAVNVEEFPRRLVATVGPLVSPVGARRGIPEGGGGGKAEQH